jgi:hypothetical protein
VLAGRSSAEPGPHELENFPPRQSGPLGCFHGRWNSHSGLPLVARRSCSRSWMLGESGGVCTSGSSVHNGCMGTSCRTWSWSLHSCCTRSESGQPTLVLYPGRAGLPHCSGFVRGQCSVAGAGLWRRRQDLREGEDKETGLKTYRRAKLMWQVKHLKGLTLVSAAQED